jgi:hypothetical protein
MPIICTSFSLCSFWTERAIKKELGRSGAAARRAHGRRMWINISKCDYDAKLPGGKRVSSLFRCLILETWYSLWSIILFASTDVSSTKICLYTSILAKSITGRREYNVYEAKFIVCTFLSSAVDEVTGFHYIHKYIWKKRLTYAKFLFNDFLWITCLKKKLMKLNMDIRTTPRNITYKSKF